MTFEKNENLQLTLSTSQQHFLKSIGIFHFRAFATSCNSKFSTKYMPIMIRRSSSNFHTQRLITSRFKICIKRRYQYILHDSQILLHMSENWNPDAFFLYHIAWVPILANMLIKLMQHFLIVPFRIQQKTGAFIVLLLAFEGF